MVGVGFPQPLEALKSGEEGRVWHESCKEAETTSEKDSVLNKDPQTQLSPTQHVPQGERDCVLAAKTAATSQNVRTLFHGPR